ncbi:Na(+)/H(+) antiporter subunit B [Halomonas sp.]|uniref:Na(+)/H(+) antiporter subunit B n=1 Tax=Halomonas sp. TaxID=1486246 RepID=UPI003A101188
MLVAAVVAVYQKHLLAAIIASGVVSLSASVVYVMLAAPDVAMTEAAIGSAHNHGGVPLRPQSGAHGEGRVPWSARVFGNSRHRRLRTDSPCRS